MIHYTIAVILLIFICSCSTYVRNTGDDSDAVKNLQAISSNQNRTPDPVTKPEKKSVEPKHLLVNPQFTIEQLQTEPVQIRYIKNRLPLVNRGPDKSLIPSGIGQSIVWLSSYTLYVMDKESGKLWASYSPYFDWSVESFSMVNNDYPDILLGVSMSALFPFNRILDIDLSKGAIKGYYELPKNLAGPYIICPIKEKRYFGVSYQGDNSWRLFLLQLSEKSIIEKAVMFKDLGLPSGRGYYAFNGNHTIFYFNNRGFMICVDTNTLEILIKKDMRATPIKQIAFIPERDELCVLSMESISLLDPQNLNIKQSFDFPKQPAIQDYINSKTGEVFWKKGAPIFLTPSGVTYRKLTNELIVTFDYSPDMLLINCDSKKHRLVNFTEKSITLGQPVYFDEQHLLIGGKYVYDFSSKATKQITGAENSMVLDSILNY